MCVHACVWWGREHRVIEKCAIKIAHIFYLYLLLLQTTSLSLSLSLSLSPGYVRLKVEDKSSLFNKYINSDGYLLPEKFRSAWFTSLVTKVVTQIKNKDPSLAVELRDTSHGPAIQVDITEKSSKEVHGLL